MLLPLVIFVFVVGLVMATYGGLTWLPEVLAKRDMDRRLRDVTVFTEPDAGSPAAATVVRREKQGPLPVLDRLIAVSGIGKRFTRLIQQSGVETTASSMLLVALIGAVVAGFAASVFISSPIALPIAAVVGMASPFVWLMHKASRRIKRFEEQFPEALDLLSRAIRAGHAFQTAMGMVAEEVSAPVGPEFKTSFEQQNFGLPLKDVLNELAERVNLLDVRFFVTAVLIQRDTGGNLAEILDNLAHVVRERFKILRQVRVHTAHGRFTGYVLLALPAFLACALMVINPEHMGLLFKERMGQMMVAGALVMQTVGFFWIRHVIKIEV